MIDQYFNNIYVHGVREDGEYPRPELLLKEMDAAGMLATIPEPMEIEYCTQHKDLRGPSGVCRLANEYLAGGGAGSIENCIIVKLREVVE